MTVAEAMLSEGDGKVLAWREEQFLNMQFSPLQAQVLAESHADLHVAADIIKDGCPHAIAADILLD